MADRPESFLLQRKRGKTVVRFHWLLPSFLSVFLLTSAAEAARLQSWRFDAGQNRLFITTDGGVQPKAQLIFNPTRLVIDLPGTRLGGSPVTQPLTGGIRAIRVGQFDAQTARIVVELSQGYTIDPQQVRFQGLSPSQWTVDIPQPTFIGSDGNSSSGNIGLGVQPLPPESTNAEGRTVVQGIQVTADGFFIRTSGDRPQIRFQQSQARDFATIDIDGATVSSQVSNQDQVVNQHGVDRLEIRQLPTSPPMARITLRMKEANDWQASVSNLGGVIVLPTNRRGNVTTRPPLPPLTRRNPNPLAAIQSIEVTNDGTQVLVRTDRPISFTSGWDRQSGAYWLRIPKALLRSGSPSSSNNSVAISAGQEDTETVVIWVQPAAGVQVTRVVQPTPQLLSVQLRRPLTSLPPLTRNPNPVSQPPRNYPTPELPPARNGRMVVVVDPGHGGGDPGAVGIGGLQEKEIVLDISQQVAQLLEQQGVQVVMTRTDDREIDLQPRVSLAERVNANLFVSIHANAINMSRPDVNGIETYYYDSGEELARTIHSSLVQATGAPDRRVRQARFYVLRKTSMPSVLLEVGFVTGADDAARLSNPGYRSQVAAAIARGVLLYLRR